MLEINHTCGVVLEVRLESLRVAYALKCDEKADASARDGWTETTTSLERYAMRATGGIVRKVQ
jgi:hypothetical protein